VTIGTSGSAFVESLERTPFGEHEPKLDGVRRDGCLSAWNSCKTEAGNGSWHAVGEAQSGKVESDKKRNEDNENGTPDQGEEKRKP
jgi:hypothetical protein